MKIDGTHGRGAIDRVETRQDTRARERSAEAPRGGDTVKVSVSSRARQLAEARAPEKPDQARIARLKEAVEKGTLDVDPAKIANAMLREER